MNVSLIPSIYFTARFQRYVQQPIRLHDGTKIPAGVTIEVPHIAIVQDPVLYPDPAVQGSIPRESCYIANNVH
jgi:hypothetical protein